MKKKYLLLVLILIFTCACVCGLVACDHKHTYSEDWTIDKNYHWHEATCEHTNRIKDKARHKFGENLRCVCGKLDPKGTEGLMYELSSDNEGYVVSYIGAATGTDIVIGSLYNGKPVIGIEENSFLNCKDLRSISIPACITNIESGAFRGCSSLRNIYYEGDIASWCGIKGLSGLMSSDRVLYIRGRKITGKLVIPEGVTSIGDSAFRGCESLTAVTVGNGVTSIGSNAFNYCNRLLSVTIGDSVTDIGSNAFYGCDKLVEVYDLSQLNITSGSEDNGYIGYNAKIIHNSLSEKSAVDVTDEGYIFVEDEQNRIYLIGYDGKDSELILPSTYNGRGYDINEFAFYDCRQLTSVTISNNVKNIGSYAFGNCGGLTSVTIPYGVEKIEAFVFIGCANLITVNISDSIISIDGDAFYKCTKLKYNIYDNAMYLGNDINPYVVLVKCKDQSITGCNIHKNTKIIADEAFKYCDFLTGITIPNGVKSIGNGAFYYTKISNVKIPDGVISIGDTAFYECNSLKNVIIPNSVKSIGELAFNGCGELSKIYYKGTYKEWEKFGIDDHFFYTYAKIYYYSETKPTDTDNKYWRYASDGATIIEW